MAYFTYKNDGVTFCWDDIKNNPLILNFYQHFRPGTSSRWVGSEACFGEEETWIIPKNPDPSLGLMVSIPPQNRSIYRGNSFLRTYLDPQGIVILF